MNKLIKTAFVKTLPVLAGYMVLGFGFGILLNAAGHSIWLALCMSLFIYAGSMQYVALGLFGGGASLITVALTTLMVNARHLFYGISMLDKYKNMGAKKPYLIFALTDETYSLLCNDNPDTPDGKRGSYYLLVSLFNQFYWVAGSVFGAAFGSLVSFNTGGIDFALTALFVTVFVEQWLNSKNHLAAITGVAASVLCLAVFGADNFLIPTMLVIALLLCFYKGEWVND